MGWAALASIVVDGGAGVSAVGLCGGGRRASSCEWITSAAAGGGRSGGGGEITLFVAALAIGAGVVKEESEVVVALVGVKSAVAMLEAAGAGAAAVTNVVVEAAAEPLRNALVTSNRELEADAISPALAKAEAALIGCISRKAGRTHPFEGSHRPGYIKTLTLGQSSQAHKKEGINQTFVRHELVQALSPFGQIRRVRLECDSRRLANEHESDARTTCVSGGPKKR